MSYHSRWDDDLISYLGGPIGDFQRDIAKRKLEELGEVAVPRLIYALFDPKKRQDARDVLIRIGVPAVPLLIKSLGNSETFDNGEIYYVSRSVIVIIGNPAIPTLIEALKDKDRNIREKVADCIVGIQGIVDCYKSIEEVKKFEIILQENFDRLSKKYKGEDLVNIKTGIAKLKMAIAKKKNQLSEDKGDLVDRILKPPIRGMYQTTRTGNSQQRRRLRNG